MAGLRTPIPGKRKDLLGQKVKKIELNASLSGRIISLQYARQNE
jgi:hypothetical protein